MAYLGVNTTPVVVSEVSGVSVGTIVEFPIGKIQGSFLKTDGTNYSRQTFPDLYAYLGTETLPLREHEYRIGDVKWFPKRQSIDPDFLPADGEIYNRVDYPAVTALLDTQVMHWQVEADWIKDKNTRTHWTRGDGSTTFRVPDMNGKSEGSLGSVFVRGDGKNSGQSGLIQGDAIREISGSATLHGTGEQNGMFGAATGAFNYSGVTSTGKAAIVAGTTATTAYRILRINASGSVPTAEENRPLNTSGCWAVRVKYSTEFAIKAAGYVENEGMANFGGLVQENIELRKQIAELMPQIGSNENGSWVKHSDGRLECTYTGSQSHRIHISVPPFSVSDPILVTFPHKFIENPVIEMQGGRGSNDSNFVMQSVRVVNTGSFYYSVFALGANPSLGAHTSYRATGRWK
ncbi:MAG: hypothetical protein ACRCWQ_14755 [Bacilli bacterium]